jgi:glycosyltransferase involved in cell wall biosynthesis
VRVLIDYRPALRERSGAGEYTHQLVRALAARYGGGIGSPLHITVFSSSWKDRLTNARELGAVSAIDRRVPVSVLNFAWHRLGWPPAELIGGGGYDVTHSSHPLILPSRGAAHVITIHALNFLAHPERTRAEVKRDYAALAPQHARRADRILVPSQFTAGEVQRQFGVAPEQLVICPAGAPDWKARTAAPANGYILFVGTLEPRKNIGGLLDAYERLVQDSRSIPELVLAGRATHESRAWLDRIARPPLAGAVRYAGYVEPARARDLYAGAAVLVLPSFEEGFGIPVLEAMTLGVPVVASRRGSLPEVVADAGLLIDPDRPREIADAVRKIVTDAAFAADLAARGLARARAFRWEATAGRVYDAYRQAVEHHAHRR